MIYVAVKELFSEFIVNSKIDFVKIEEKGWFSLPLQALCADGIRQYSLVMLLVTKFDSKWLHSARYSVRKNECC